MLSIVVIISVSSSLPYTSEYPIDGFNPSIEQQGKHPFDHPDIIPCSAPPLTYCIRKKYFKCFTLVAEPIPLHDLSLSQ